MSTPEATTAAALPPASLTHQQSLTTVLGTLIRRELSSYTCLSQRDGETVRMKCRCRSFRSLIANL